MIPASREQRHGRPGRRPRGGAGAIGGSRDTAAWTQSGFWDPWRPRLSMWRSECSLRCAEAPSNAGSLGREAD